MAETVASRFDKALKDRGLQLDDRDKAAALRVFAGLERGCALLKAADQDAAGQGDDRSR